MSLASRGRTDSRVGARRLALGGLAALTAFAIACSPPSTGSSTTPPVTGPSETPVTQSPDIVLVGAGDIAKCHEFGAITTGPLMEAALAKYPNATAFTAGDNVYDNGTPTDFQDCYEPTWGRFKARTRSTPGNHEYNSGGAGYFGYFGAGAGPSGLGYYAYTLGAWRVISLNSEYFSGGRVPDAQAAAAEMQWLRDELSTNRHNCTVAIWHRPLYSSADNGNQLDMKELFRTLYDGNVDVVLNGHDHDYERFAPQDADGHRDDGRGIRMFVVGSGGNGVYHKQRTLETSEVFISSWGVLALTLTEGAYRWEFTQVSGASGETRGVVSLGDAGSGSCH